MTINNISKFTFPVGYHKFHKKQVFNFQLNRWHSFGYARFEDMKEVGQKIETFNDWKTEMEQLAEKAVSENRLMNTALYYRAAEFYILQDNSEKKLMYDKFSEYFHKAFEKLFLQMNENNLHSDMVKQDVLILTGRNDHIIPFRAHDMQIKALTNAKSVTGRVFTKEEQAHNHCQIGNTGLALDVMLKWIDEKS